MTILVASHNASVTRVIYLADQNLDNVSLQPSERAEIASFVVTLGINTFLASIAFLLIVIQVKGRSVTHFKGLYFCITVYRRKCFFGCSSSHGHWEKTAVLSWIDRMLVRYILIMWISPWEIQILITTVAVSVLWQNRSWWSWGRCVLPAFSRWSDTRTSKSRKAASCTDLPPGPRTKSSRPLWTLKGERKPAPACRHARRQPSPLDDSAPDVSACRFWLKPCRPSLRQLSLWAMKSLRSLSTSSSTWLQIKQNGQE